ncbi:hypothetical protein QOT17_015568 [Balamuthia mandrillaris]
MEEKTDKKREDKEREREKETSGGNAAAAVLQRSTSDEDYYYVPSSTPTTTSSAATNNTHPHYNVNTSSAVGSTQGREELDEGYLDPQLLTAPTPSAPSGSGSATPSSTAGKEERPHVTPFMARSLPANFSYRGAAEQLRAQVHEREELHTAVAALHSREPTALHGGEEEEEEGMYVVPGASATIGGAAGVAGETGPSPGSGGSRRRRNILARPPGTSKKVAESFHSQRFMPRNASITRHDLREYVRARKSKDFGLSHRVKSLSFVWNERFQAIIDRPTTQVPNMENLAHIFNQNVNEFRQLLSQENEEFTTILEVIEQELQKKVDILRLLQEFQDKATMIAKTIVEEIPLPDAEKSVPPVDAGGISGGQKFTYEGIFFKMGRDWKGVYGWNDDAAMRSLGNELKGLKAYFKASVPGLYVPLTIAVEYKGYRLLASSVININGTKSLVYGSADRGNTVFNRNKTMSQLMEQAADHLNLKGHVAGTDRNTCAIIHSPTDMEGHLGLDGKLYVLDTSHVFPPVPPRNTALLIPQDDILPAREIEVPWEEGEDRTRVFTRILGQDTANHAVKETAIGSFYYCLHGKKNVRASTLTKQNLTGDVIAIRFNTLVSSVVLLRPELVRANPVPLCSDAFSEYQQLDPEKSVHDEEVLKTTSTLSHIIAEVAEGMKAHTIQPVDHEDFIEELHMRGVNVRFLGLVRTLCGGSQQHLRSFLLTEMCARVMKNKLRRIMRNAVLKGLDDATFRKIIVNQFNLFLGTAPKSRSFWMTDLKVRLQHDFISALSEEEMQPSYDLRQQLMRFPLFKRIQEMTGVRFKIGAQKRLFTHPFLFDNPRPLSVADIEDFQALSKNIYVKESEIPPLLRKALEGREREAYQLTQLLSSDPDVIMAYNALLEQRYHQELEKILGEDSREVIKSYYQLAQLYRKIGNMSLALDYASRGLSKGEVLFGSFSEETVMGLVTVGQIFKRIKEQEAFKSGDSDMQQITNNDGLVSYYFQRALNCVENLHKLHPLLGKLNLELFFSFMHSKPLRAKRYLLKSYTALSSLYGPEPAKLVIPLLAMRNNVDSVIKKVDRTIETMFEVPLLDVAECFWPKPMLEVVAQVTDSQNDIESVLGPLGLTEYLKAFQQHGVLTFDSLLQLTEEDLRDTIGIKKLGPRRKLWQLIKSKRAAREKQELSKEARRAIRTTDWNEYYQLLLDSEVHTLEDGIARAKRLDALAAEFCRVASESAKIVVNEFYLPKEQKTIQPIREKPVEGQTTLHRYIHKRLIITLASTTDEYSTAAKPISLELSGNYQLLKYYQQRRGEVVSDLDYETVYEDLDPSFRPAKDNFGSVVMEEDENEDIIANTLHTTMMAVVDYMGFRVMAMTVLPISSTTLAYGLADRNTFVSNSIPVKRAVDKVGQWLNVCPHSIFGTECSLCFDIEGHVGDDGRFYLIYLGQMYPPIAPVNNGETVFIRRFRPEYLRKYPKQLCSDAFLKVLSSEERAALSKTVTEASEEFLYSYIPSFAQYLDDQSHLVFSKAWTDYRYLTNLLHASGINMRYLGYILQKIRSHDLRSLLFEEMVVRTGRHLLRRELRTYLQLRVLARKGQHACLSSSGDNNKEGKQDSANASQSSNFDATLPKEIVVKFLNSLLQPQQHQDYWKRVFLPELVTLFPPDGKFCSGSSEEGTNKTVELQQATENALKLSESMQLHHFLLHFCSSFGLVISPELQNSLTEQSQGRANTVGVSPTNNRKSGAATSRQQQDVLFLPHDILAIEPLVKMPMRSSFANLLKSFYHDEEQGEEAVPPV